MHYVQPIVVLPENTIDNPAIEEIQLSAGTLTDAMVVFPPGCARLVRIQIYHGVNQILPTNTDMYYAEDAMAIPIKENLTFSTGSNRFYIVGWNVGASYRHQVNVHFDVRDVTEFTTAEAITYQTEVLALLSERIRGYY